MRRRSLLYRTVVLVVTVTLIGGGGVAVRNFIPLAPWAWAHGWVLKGKLALGLGEFFQTGERKHFHEALGETRRPPDAVQARLYQLAQEYCGKVYDIDVFTPLVADLYEERGEKYIPPVALELKEAYLTQQGRRLIGNLYWEAPQKRTGRQVPFVWATAKDITYARKASPFDQDPCFMQTLFQDERLDKLDLVRILFGSYKTDDGGVDHLILRSSATMDRAQIKEIRDWSKAQLAKYIRTECEYYREGYSFLRFVL